VSFGKFGFRNRSTEMSALGLVGVESWACGGADIPLSFSAS